MDLIYILTIAILIIAYLYTKKETSEVTQEKAAEKIQLYPYKKKYLLTKAEYTFYNILKSKCEEENILICPKVRLEDFIEITTNEHKQKYRGYIKSRHVDYLLCDSKLNIIAAIELDDNSHYKKSAIKTDNFKNKLFETIGIKLYRIKMSEGKYQEHVNKLIEDTKLRLQNNS